MAYRDKVRGEGLDGKLSLASSPYYMVGAAIAGLFSFLIGTSGGRLRCLGAAAIDLL